MATNDGETSHPQIQQPQSDLSHVGLDETPEPEQELVDLTVARNDIRVNETHDLALISGIENVKQSVALDVRDVAHFHVGDQLTSNNVFDVRAQVERSLNADPQISAPTSVVVDAVDLESHTINFTVTTHDNEDFTLDIVLPE
jgi:hypothetical protein